ncbi:MAG: right-handed parallel beta-helix repeat-containing protein [Ignavibacteria bacterium]|nr:right-handed parallel beta-helix repeat-containing protein [Ignavibacteria bacterium]
MLVSKNMLVKNNVVSNSCMTLNDGGGIDLDDADGLQRYLIILSSILSECGIFIFSQQIYANGIYFGPNVTKNVLIKGNTIVNNSYVGINVDNSDICQ